jgi:hypothetical protein
MFESMVVITIQNAFQLEKYQNNIFNFFKFIFDIK